MAAGDHDDSIAQTNGGVLRAGSLRLFGLIDAVPIRTAYKLAFITNFYREPLLRHIEREHALTRPEWTILICLAYRSPLNPRDITAFTEQPRNNISRGTALLSTKGLVSSRPDPQDARRALLHLTDAGRALHDRVMPLFEERQREVMAALDPDEQRDLDRLLTKLAIAMPIER